MSTRSDIDSLRAEVTRLGPWNHEVEITPGLSTRAWLEASPDSRSEEFGTVSLANPREPFQALLRTIFSAGLEGRSALDCACNCGGFLFWAKELGAGRCFGFDVREHWIRQARFLVEHRTAPTDDMRFEVCDLYDVPQLGLEPFDVTFFHGVFYHLPDPVTGLRIAADLTKEVLVVSTTTQSGHPDGALVVSEESRTWLRSGVYGLNWFPTGPEVMSRILCWMGFTEVRPDRWRRRRGQRMANREELRIVAARTPEALADYDRAMAAPSPAREAAQEAPAGAVVLVATGGDERLLELGDRRAWHYPQAGNGGWLGKDLVSGGQAVRQLTLLGAEGADYLLLPPEAVDLPRRFPELGTHLRERATLVAETAGCALYALS
jgi:tRNA (mo5U34)-methyltransferase